MPPADAQPDTPDEAKAAQLVAELAKAHGFALCGVAPAERSQYADFLRDWLGKGHHGEMDYLANHAEVRVDPREMVPGAQCVIVVADAYAAGKGLRGQGAQGPSEENQDSSESQPLAPGPLGPSAPSGKIAKYAWGDDYHKTIKKRLHTICDALSAQYPGYTFRTTVDTAPIFERELATKAGLGWTGKHTLMIHPRYGSYFLLGTIVTTLPITTSEAAGYPPPLSQPTDHCGSCTRCIDACPTDAIAPEGYTVNATRCISYLTLEHRSEIEPGLFAGMGDWVAGCDVCLDACPHNRRRLDGAVAAGPIDLGDTDIELPIHPRYTPRQPAPALDLLNILDWAEDDRRRICKGSALKRIKLDMWKRNALIALGNALRENDSDTIRAKIEAIASDNAQPEMVRITAREVLALL